MSTKNLARSIVEGGKAKEYRFKKQILQKRFRKQNKMFCKGFSETEPSSHKRDWLGYLSKEEAFSDKFGCFTRFMFKARKKSSYEDVKSYLVRKYGNKSVKARHLMEHFETWRSRKDRPIDILSSSYKFHSIKNYW